MLNKLVRIGVIAHLYYSDLLRESIFYFRNLPSEVELIVTTPEQHIEYIRELLKGINRQAVVLPAGPKGRDVAALLVTAHDYLMQYDLLCFIHDKKTTGGQGSAEIGERFRKLLWNNLLGSNAVVQDIVSLFDTNPSLGVVAPPLPYRDEYFLCLGDPWSTSFTASQNVLNMLGISRILCLEDEPRAISTAFWCRPTALRKLFTYPFSYDDFPPEPLPLNGAINHGIEHAISFIAEAAGYQTQIYSCAEDKNVILNDYEYMLSRICRELSKKYYFTTFRGLMRELEDDTLRKFCANHELLMVYGGGYHGLRLLPILERMGYHAEKFVISDGYNLPKALPLPVCHLSQIKPATNIGIIVAAAQAYRVTMREKLEKNGWSMESCYFLQ